MIDRILILPLLRLVEAVRRCCWPPIFWSFRTRAMPLRVQRAARVGRRRGARIDGCAQLLGAAAALAHSENVGNRVLRRSHAAAPRRICAAVSALLVLITAAAVSVDALTLGVLTTGQTTGSGLRWSGPSIRWARAACACGVRARPGAPASAGGNRDRAGWSPGGLTGAIYAWGVLSPDTLPGGGPLMLAGFVICLVGGMPIGFALALSALIFIWVEGTLARGDFRPADGARNR